MLYRQLFTIKDLSIQPSEWNRFELRGGSAEVALEPFADTEAAAGVTLDITRAQVTLTARDPKPQNRALLDELRNIRGPESIQEAHDALVAARTGADWRGRDIVYMEMLPRSFQDYAAQIRETIEQLVLEFTAFFRWRLALPGAVMPIAERGRLTWSDDGVMWQLMPLVVSAKAIAKVRPLLDRQRRDDLVARFEAGQREPVAREILREAFDVVEDNPRSALALAVAALEVAVKRTIAELQPAVAWLVAQPGAPPAVSMLTELLPNVPLRRRFTGDDVVPKPLVDAVRKAVFARNALVHFGASAPGRDSLHALMIAIRDTMLILDYVSGYEWAYGQLTDPTKALVSPQ